MASYNKNGRDSFGGSRYSQGWPSGYGSNSGDPYDDKLSATNRFQDYFRDIDYDYVNRGWNKSRIVALIVGVVIAFLVICGFDLYRSQQSVVAEAKATMLVVDDLKGAMKHGDRAALDKAVADVVDEAHKVHGEVNSPAWLLASFVPYFGSDVRSVQTLADVAVDLAENALVPVADNPTILNAKDVFKNGAVDLDALGSLSDSLEEAAPVFLRNVNKIAALPDAHTERLDETLSSIKEDLGSTSGMIELAQSLLPEIDSLMGGDGAPRNYLVVAYSNAELRSDGGFPGSWTLVTVNDGEIEMGKTVALQLKPDDFITFREDELALFPGLKGNMGSIPFLPDFRRVAPYLAQGYEYHRGVHVDGVIAIDPVFLQRILKLTGGVVASDGTKVDGTNAAWELMSNAYWRFGNAGSLQDRFFGEVASLSFDKLMHDLGKVSLTDLYSTLSSSASDHRLQIWFENDYLQKAFARQGFSGALSDDPTRPELGIFLNDDTWAKIGWYAKLDTYVSNPKRNPDGSKTYDVTTTISNTAWKDELEYSPRYIWGYNQEEKLTDSDMILAPLFVAPAGGKISDLTLNGEPWDMEHTLYDRQVYYGVVHADVGESVVVRYEVTTSPDAIENLEVRKTPLAQERLLTIQYGWKK